ncbi:MAG: C2H2-type zinc finger protein, partial [Candidatus Endonucleobacter bathymodioli]|nr:C2H2-type zinc finger protein [Candidatus Endonucleobacter bathymodioli]
GDENFLLYFPCSVKDTSTNHYTRTSYAFFLFEKYDSDLRSYPCILRALAGSNDIDEDRVAERVGNDTLYSKRVSGTTIETCQNGDLWIKCGGECNIGCRYKSSLEAACVEYIANHMIKHKIKACFMDDKSGKPYAFIVYMAMKSKMNTHDYKQILEYPPAVNMLLEKTGQNFDAIHQAKNKIQLFLTNEEAQIQAEEQHAARLMEMTTTQLLSDLSCVQQSKSVADTVDHGTLPNYQPVDHRTTPNLPAGMLSDLRCHISQVANVENQNHDAKLLSGIMNSQDKCSDYNIEKEILEGNKAGPLVNNTASAGSNKAGSDSILHDGERRYGDTGTNKLPKQRIAYSAAPSHHCDICKKSFQYKSKLQSHMISHCKDQPYICGICGNQFKVTSSLTRHMLSHIEDQPYTCEICGKSGQGGFRSHMRIHMYTPADEKPYYRCEICATKFGSLSHLKVHMNIHTKEKSYSCEICGKEFGRNANLGRHMRIHTGEKLYSCDVCGMDLGRKADLNKHMAFHSSAKYSCDICNKPFKDHKSLTRHVRHIHKK